MSDEKKPDDSEPSAERQAELQAAYEANTAAGKAPYASVVIRTHNEVRWIMNEHRWTGQRDAKADVYANLSGAELQYVNLHRVRLDGANLKETWFRGADMSGAFLEGANLTGAILAEADLSEAFLDEANLSSAYLRDADLRGASLVGARMDSDTKLHEVSFNSATALCDVTWNGASLARIDWAHVRKLGDEREARRNKEYPKAVRAYRQLAVTLRGQGLNEVADRFAYRAQLMQRVVLRRQCHYLRWLGSLFLWLIAGYGYRPLRSVLSYVLVVAGFAVAYYLLGNNVTPSLSIHDAIVFSVTSFHGRGFSPGEAITLHNPLTTLAAAEAVLGLLIEITFIATFTNRFFAR